MAPLPVMDLPAELRELIWAYAMTNDDPIDIRKLRKHNWHVHQDPPLTKVSRLVRQEALSFFYSQNVFESPFHTDLLWFLFNLQNGRLEMLRDVRYRTPASSMSFLRQLRGYLAALVEKGMKADAVSMLIKEEREGELWIRLSEIEDFEDTNERKVMRRKMRA